jgi:hypothetical protein
MLIVTIVVAVVVIVVAVMVVVIIVTIVFPFVIVAVRYCRSTSSLFLFLFVVADHVCYSFVSSFRRRPRRCNSKYNNFAWQSRKNFIIKSKQTFLKTRI